MKLYCIFCNKEFDFSIHKIRCENCNQPLIVVYEGINDGDFLVEIGSSSIWRFGWLPRLEGYRVSMGEGFTYLYSADNLIKEFGFGGGIFIKDESRNPTGSFVDRGVSVSISNILGHGFKRVVTVSPGNLGVSISAYASRAGLNSLIYLPKYVEKGKLYQILMYGGDVELYDDFGLMVMEIYRLHREGRDFYPLLSDNPLYIEGVKTIAYELYEYFGSNLPEFIVVPMGNGALIYSIFKGFYELLQVGLIEEVPKLVGVQISGSSKIIDVLYGEEGAGSKLMAPEISINTPLNLSHAVYAIKESSGLGIKVDYDEVVDALRLAASKEGLIIELAAASTIAALRRLVDKVGSSDVVLIITGHGLKDPVTVRELTKSARRRLGLETIQRSVVGRTKVEILRAIYDGYRYGYIISKYLKSRGISVSLPTIYQHLSELEELGLVKISGSIGISRRRTIYDLTEKGLAFLRILSPP